MKKLFFVLICFCFAINILAQEQDSPKKYIYCELVGTSKMLSSKVNVEIDFGQAQNLFKTKDSRLRDDNGKVINFNSMVDALNYMGTLNWEFVQAYVVTSNNQNIYHWLLKKELSQEDLDELGKMVSKKDK